MNIRESLQILMDINTKKRKKMKIVAVFKCFLWSVVACTIVLCLGACEEVNDWAVDKNYDRAFTPTVFKLYELNASSVVVKFSPIQLTSGYIIEVSRDNSFVEIYKTFSITKDDVVQDPMETSEMYLYTVNGLLSATEYFIRLKAVSSMGAEDSKWTDPLIFTTSSEQIINSIKNVTTTSATIVWTPGADVTHLIYSKQEDGIEVVLALDDTQIEVGEYEMTGLESNTGYEVKVCYISSGPGEDIVYTPRGSRSFITKSGIAVDGIRIDLNAGDDIQAKINEVPSSETAITLVFTSDVDYDLSGQTLTIPGNITSLVIWGLGEKMSRITQFRGIVTSSLNKLYCYNMDFEGYGMTEGNLKTGNVFWTVNSAAANISEIKIEDCEFTSWRGCFRLQLFAGPLSLIMGNSQFYRIGDYGVLNTNCDATISNINVMNSTFNTCVYLMLFNKGTVNNSILVDHCTFYDLASFNANDLFLFNGGSPLPEVLRIDKSIFANPSFPLGGTNQFVADQFVFDSYKTTDCDTNNKYPLVGIKDYGKASTDLFKDPLSGDFTIVDETIDPSHDTGDPRWWN